MGESDLHEAWNIGFWRWVFVRQGRLSWRGGREVKALEAERRPHEVEKVPVTLLRYNSSRHYTLPSSRSQTKRQQNCKAVTGTF